MKWSKFIKFMWLSVGIMPCWMPVALETRRGPGAVCLSPASALAEGSRSLMETTLAFPLVDETMPLAAVEESAVAGAPVFRLGDYRLLKKLGAGGMGEVYEVASASTVAGENRLALKMISARAACDPQVAQRFKVEALLHAQLSAQHGNIVQLHAWSDTPQLHIVMEKLDGKNLEQLLGERKEQGKTGLPEKQVIEIGLQAARALHAVHTTPVVDFDGNIRIGVVHRDVKPSNLFWENGRVVLTDFGLAMLPGMEEEEGMIYGTPAYMPSEQWEGFGLDGRTDVYALGAVLFHLVNGYPAFKAKSVSEMRRKVDYHQVEPFRPGVGPELEAIIRKAMASLPSQRYQSAEEMAEALAGLKESRASRFAPQNRLKLYFEQEEFVAAAA